MHVYDVSIVLWHAVTSVLYCTCGYWCSIPFFYCYTSIFDVLQMPRPSSLHSLDRELVRSTLTTWRAVERKLTSLIAALQQCLRLPVTTPGMLLFAATSHVRYSNTNYLFVVVLSTYTHTKIIIRMFHNFNYSCLHGDWAKTGWRYKIQWRSNWNMPSGSVEHYLWQSMEPGGCSSGLQAAGIFKIQWVWSIW